MKKLIMQHRRLSAQIKSLQQDLEAIERNPEYAKELAFMNQLDSLMAEHGKNADDVLLILNPSVLEDQGNTPRRANAGTPRQRVKYKNPHTGEEITTASGNNRTLKQWKKEYPNEDMKDWIV